MLNLICMILWCGLVGGIKLYFKTRRIWSVVILFCLGLEWVFRHNWTFFFLYFFFSDIRWQFLIFFFCTFESKHLSYYLAIACYALLNHTVHSYFSTEFNVDCQNYRHRLQQSIPPRSEARVSNSSFFKSLEN
jgi:hypothetical protein